MEQFNQIFASGEYMPHGYCYRWTPWLLTAHVGSDLLTFIAYFSIPAALLILIQRRPDLGKFKFAIWLFIFFIASCGTTHGLEAVAVWIPIYEVTAIMKMATASISLITAVVIWPLLPKVIKLPSNTDLIRINEKLEKEIKKHQETENELKKHKEELEVLISERTKSLEEINLKLTDSNKDLEQFAYAASHDLKEPLRMVSSYMVLIEEQVSHQFDEKTKTYFEFAKDGARRMGQLISDLLDFSRIGKNPSKVIKFDLAIICQDMLNLYSRNYPDIDIQIHYPASYEIQAEVMQMKTLMQNLIGNAIKYRSDQRAVRIDILAVQHEHEYQITVQDNGIGFEERHKDKIFEVFKRLHHRSSYSGNGIGLAICKRIVEHHGGRIWAESEVGIGSRFIFSIPSKPIIYENR